MSIIKRKNEVIENVFVTAFRKILALLTTAVLSQTLMADSSSPDTIRIGKAVGKFHDVRQFSAVYHRPAPRLVGAEHIELAVGIIGSTSDIGTFISIGPVWRFESNVNAYYLEFGFSPTFFSRASYGGADIGGNIHFTSSLTIGTRFGHSREYDLGIRLQHTSNGGLDATNPGLDAIAVNFTKRIWSF